MLNYRTSLSHLRSHYMFERSWAVGVPTPAAPCDPCLHQQHPRSHGRRSGHDRGIP